MIHLGLYLHMAFEFVESVYIKNWLKFVIDTAEFRFCPQPILYFQELASETLGTAAHFYSGQLLKVINLFSGIYLTQWCQHAVPKKRQVSTV
jgi:hypothetical protein